MGNCWRRMEHVILNTTKSRCLKVVPKRNIREINGTINVLGGSTYVHLHVIKIQTFAVSEADTEPELEPKYDSYGMFVRSKEFLLFSTNTA